jgi:hypothetical protein
LSRGKGGPLRWGPGALRDGPAGERRTRAADGGRGEAHGLYDRGNLLLTHLINVLHHLLTIGLGEEVGTRHGDIVRGDHVLATLLDEHPQPLTGLRHLRPRLVSTPASLHHGAARARRARATPLLLDHSAAAPFFNDKLRGECSFHSHSEGTSKSRRQFERFLRCNASHVRYVPKKSSQFPVVLARPEHTEIGVPVHSEPDSDITPFVRTCTRWHGLTVRGGGVNRKRRPRVADRPN